jgi:general secretion pathway protein G
MRFTNQSARRVVLLERGMTLIELVIVCAIMAILAGAAMPMGRVIVKRQKEQELRIDLREMRNAIDAYKDAADRGLIRTEVDTFNYPPDLQTLVDGVDLNSGGGSAIGATGAPVGSAPTSGAFMSGPTAGSPSTSGGFGSSNSSSSSGLASVTLHVRFLRKIPIDPMTGKADWGMRSVQDDPDSNAWGGQDIFDVYTKATGTGLDGTSYSSW